MPTASDLDRVKMEQYFGGDGIDDGPVLRFLAKLGWTFPRGMCVKPKLDGYYPSPKEMDCVYFLCDEWDYGYEGHITNPTGKA